MIQSYIACDLGAESGRVILGQLANGKLELEEIHRFSNGASSVQGSLRWNILHIFSELKAGLKKLGNRGITAESLSVDSWGVDYVLFRANAPLVSQPYHYRDARTDSVYECVKKNVTSEKIFAETGIQFMSINTLYQFAADTQNNPELLAVAEKFLNIGDYLNYLFCGEAKAEESLASTTQIYNPNERRWSKALIAALELPERIFPEIVPSGTKLAPLSPEIVQEAGLKNAPEVVATCSHDTGCAVAAVPADADDRWAYLSSGTWSLLGVELPTPLINDDVLAANFTNEAGVAGTTRFLKNTAGLWILQECRRSWEAEGRAFNYDQLTEFAEDADSLRSIINPNDPRFQKPGEMLAKIDAFCRETNQPVPNLPGDYVRCILESLALLYRYNVETLRRLTQRPIERIHIVGGGSKNRLLNQFAANATRCTIYAGPVEATAIGNVLIQALALGHLKSLEELRATVRNSFRVERYEPVEADLWQHAYERFTSVSKDLV